MEKYSYSYFPIFIISIFTQVFPWLWSIYPIKEIILAIRGKLSLISNLKLPNGPRLEREIYFIILGELRLCTCIHTAWFHSQNIWFYICQSLQTRGFMSYMPTGYFYLGQQLGMLLRVHTLLVGWLSNPHSPWFKLYFIYFLTLFIVHHLVYSSRFQQPLCRFFQNLNAFN